jgi:phage N-6-adenine-methyltransferase
MINQHHDMPLRNEHYTPKWVFDKLDIMFDLDVASPEGGSHVPCKQYFTEADDGLAKEWHGNVWMNPPFSNATKWANKFMDYGQGIAILPNSNAIWVDRLWNSDASIYKMPYHTFYERPDGPAKRIMYTTYLIALGNDNKEAIKRVGRVR